MVDIKSFEIAIAMTTMYPKWYRGKVRSIKHIDKIRGDLALESIRKAKELGYKVVVIERDSSDTFRKELKNIPNIRVAAIRIPKRSPGKRKAIRLAAKITGIKAIVMTEPEKLSLISDCISQIVTPIFTDEADIVVPKREDSLFAASYPKYMYESEIEGNAMYNEMLRTSGLLRQTDEDLDMFFGPRVIKNDPKILALFMKQYQINTYGTTFPKEFLDTEEYSNSQYFPIILALKKKLRVKSVTVPFVYPKIQKENEEKGERALFLEKRKSQRLGLLVELLHFVGYLGKNKYSATKVVKK